MEDLIAKAKSVKDNGFSCWVYTGNYHVPTITLTDSIEKDIMFIEEIIGVGELAISDHRSSYPSFYELKILATKARVAGMLSGKSGKVNVHVGGGKDLLNPILEVIKRTDIPIKQFIPTHMARNQEILDSAIEYSKLGGLIDITASSTKEILEAGEIKCSKAIKYLLENKVPIENISITSDGQGSLPVFDSDGNNIGLKIGKVKSVYNEIKDMVKKENIELSTALKTATSTPAINLKLKNKGFIKNNYDADIVLIDKNDLSIKYFISKGVLMMDNEIITYKPKIIQ
jgi:beta-aspartyl-dipeptidase (metallo-type)